MVRVTERSLNLAPGRRLRHLDQRADVTRDFLLREGRIRAKPYGLTAGDAGAAAPVRKLASAAPSQTART